MRTTFEEYWGIDVSKNWLDIAIGDKAFRVEQNKKSIKEFVNFHKKVNTLAVLESTGGYEKPMARYLEKSGVVVHIAHPNKVVAFAKAKGRLAKTDKIDAHLLKEYGKFINPNEIKKYITEKQEELELLGARLEQLKELHHQEICRAGIALSPLIKKSLKKTTMLIESQIKTIGKAIIAIIDSDPGLKEKYNLLRSMKGVGDVLSIALMTSLPELGEANKKEIAALVGVAPITKESGQKIGKASIRYGRPNVRRVLYMGALTACRYNLKFKDFYEKLVKAGKPKKVAIVAVMRKMIVTLNAMAQTKTYFNT